MKLSEKTVKEFLEDIAGERPTLPAAGSALALAGALSAALGQFASGVSINKSKNNKTEKTFRGIYEHMDAVGNDCADLMDRDVEAYTRVFKILKERRLQEKGGGRDPDLEEAFYQACAEPLNLAGNGVMLLHACNDLVEAGDAVVRADVEVAAELALACVRGSVWLAKANLKGLPDSNEKRIHKHALDSLLLEGKRVYGLIREHCSK